MGRHALHDIGMSVDYDDHHRHSRYLILNAGLPGFAPREVALIAQAARYHRKGMPDFGDLAPLVSANGKDAERLDRLAVLLRLAEDLERPRDQSVRAAHVATQNGRCTSAWSPTARSAVARWAASARERPLRARVRQAPEGGSVQGLVRTASPHASGRAPRRPRRPP